ncbi:MAG: hypothetical protein K6G65_08265 [Lachnospiraceae bacterium]|nr:hypothetical protein [Lachnospiraceae bacterium]
MEDSRLVRLKEKVIENSMAVILFFDEKGKIFKWSNNIEESLGYTDLKDVSIDAVFRQTFRIDHDGVKVKETGVNGVIETVIYRKNQTCFPVAMSVIVDEESGIGCCQALSVSSMREAKKSAQKAKEEMQNAERARNEFVANVTHELRTPVNGILGLTNNLLETELTYEQRDSLEAVVQCCTNMTKIINNLLDFSKLESGKFVLEEREFDFRESMNKIIKANLPLVNEKGLQFAINIAKDVPEHIIGDELRITQILNNLLSNAIKFTQKGNIIVDIIMTEVKGNEVELFFMVIDSGIGIAEDEKDKLFKSFTQVDASITRRFGGTGLGLSIVKELVELMHGIISVDSEKGVGSTFSFSIRVKTNDTVEEVKLEDMDYKSLLEDKKTDISVLMRSEKKRVQDILGDYSGEDDESMQFGTEENLKLFDDTMDKMNICMDMGNWDKAEKFAGQIKGMIPAEEADLRRKAFRMELTIRKADEEKSHSDFLEFKKAFEERVKEL